MNLFSQSNPALTVPREEVQQKLEGTDAVVHLIVGPEEPSKDGLESEGAGSSDNTGEEKKVLNKIMSGWGSRSFSGDVDGDEDNEDDEESYSPSTVGVVEVSSHHYIQAERVSVYISLFSRHSTLYVYFCRIIYSETSSDLEIGPRRILPRANLPTTSLRIL